MLIVCAKSAMTLVLGGALVGQQADNANRDVAPPAPTVDARQDLDRDAAPRNEQAREQAIPERQRATNENAQQGQSDQRSVIDNQRQTYQTPDQQNLPQDQQGRSALGVSLTDDLRVIQVSPGSPAERMGIRAGDELLSLNGQTFNSIDAFVEAVGSAPAEQQIQLEIDRNGQNLTQSGQLGAWDQVYYSGSQMAGKGMQQQGVQSHSAMRFADDGSMLQGQPIDGQFIGDAWGCVCDPCAGFGGSGGFGYGGHGLRRMGRRLEPSGGPSRSSRVLVKQFHFR